jgi:lactate dehydrogenase-like 2-hydroxyacid dehydrogenase
MPTGTADLPLVLVTAGIPDEVVERLRSHARVEQAPPEPLQTARSLAAYDEAQAWVTHHGQPVDAERLASLPALRVVANVAVGHDNVDLEAATARGVTVCNTPGVLDAAVAELTIGMVIGLLRGVVRADGYVRSGQWQRAPFPYTTDVHGKTLGILGMGRIGTRIARVAGALEMRVVYSNRSRHEEADQAGLAAYVDRETLFRGSDVVVLTVPLTEQTRGSVGAAEFAAMKRSAYLVNVARGAVVDEPALVEALRRGDIAGAALDVMATEPLPPDSPLAAMEQVLLLPHIGSATVETRRAMAELAVDGVLDVLAGRTPRAQVTPR